MERMKKNSDSNHERHLVRTVCYYELDGQWKEVSEHPMDQYDDGRVDFSHVPKAVFEEWEKQGIASKFGRVFWPKDGGSFLAVLLERAGPYLRIREKK